MDKDDPFRDFIDAVSLSRAVTIAELNLIVETVREKEKEFCAEVWANRDGKDWRIWAIAMFKLEKGEEVLPQKVYLATVRRDMSPINAEYDRNAGIGISSTLLLKRGRKEKVYKSLDGLYSDCVDVLGKETPIDLHIHGEPSEVGDN
ncbi:MAG: hypothetical protein OEM85_03950 [Gammaproteobacteria bacterium]|nr:hypothetical protein [Gammaproteobacteria bacterium]MDH3372508.1 hypothetical protein [Gammaproteobacteria bacterium]